MSEDIESYIKQVSIENTTAYIFKCPICKKTIVAKARTEAIRNGSRHLVYCRRLLAQITGASQ